MGFSISNTLSLRLFYSDNNTLVTSTKRKEATVGKLSMADSKALRSAVRQLRDYNFEDAKEDQLQQKLRAFVDTYNNTIESGKKYSVNDTAVKNAVRKMKSLTKEYSEDLEDLGITVDKSTGYMKVSESAAENITRSKFVDFFNGEENEYLDGLHNAAKHMTHRIDVRL